MWRTRPHYPRLCCKSRQPKSVELEFETSHLQEKWGQPVIVENRAGGDGIVAISAFIAATDNHTLLFTPTSAFIAHPYEYAKIPYDPHALAPIARVSSTISAFSIPATLGAATIGEFTKRALAEPGELNWVSTTGLNDLVFKSYLTINGLNLGRVPYRDLVQSMTDLAEGRVSRSWRQRHRGGHDHAAVSARACPARQLHNPGKSY